jgi:hypothetical protein
VHRVDREEQEVVHGLVHPPAVRDEPEVDGPQLADDLAADAGLLGHLADRRLRLGLTGLDVPLGQGPQQPSAAVQPADQRAGRARAQPVQHQPAGAGLVDPPQRPTPGCAPRRSLPPWRLRGRGHQPRVRCGAA